MGNVYNQRPDPRYPIDWASLPMGANPDADRVVSMDDAGRPIYQTQFGDRYAIEYTMQTTPGLPERAAGAYNALVADPGGTIGNALGGMAQGVWNGLMVPARAARGETITNGELTNTIGLMAGAGAPMAAPAGALRSGAMRTAESLTPAEMAAEEVLTRLRSGQGATVTDEMMAAADPQYLWSNYDLPMDQASRMARAREMGFDTGTPLYHGTGADFQAFGTNNPHRFGGNSGGPESKVVWMTESPAEASRYAGNEITAETGAGTPTVVPNFYRPAGETVVDSRYDVPPQPQNTFNVRQDLYSALANEPQHWRAVPDPANIRSRFARFDPRLSHLKNLSAGLAALGLTNLASMLDPEAQGGM